MDAFWSFALYFAILYVSVGVLYFVYDRTKKGGDGRKKKLPPGRRGWPIIGETIEFGMAGRNGSPEKFIDDRRAKYSSQNLFRTSLIGENLAVFCGPAGNKCLFSKENKYVKTWFPPSAKKLFFGTPPDTVEMRSFIKQFVKPEALQQYVGVMDSMAKQHLETHWFPYKQVKVVPVVKKYSFGVSCRLFMSMVDMDRVEELEDPYNMLIAGVVSLPINFPGTAFNRAIKAVKSIHKQMEPIIRQRRLDIAAAAAGHVNDDMLSHLLLIEGNGPIQNEAVIAEVVIGLILASSSTTSSAITIVINYLAQLPHVYHRVFKEQMEIAKSKGPNESLKWEDIQKMKYSWMVVCEALRLWPPNAGMFREVIQDFTFSGYTIPKGWKTYWSVFSTHKNPNYFPDPHKFDPSRFEGNGPAPYTYVPFGGGPRMCPGNEYAKIKILIFIHNLVTNFSFTKAIPNEKIVYTHSAEPVSGLPIFIQPHHH